jgi:hypothetical protein
VSLLKGFIVFVSLGFAAVAGQASVVSAADRLALVVGQGAYGGRQLPTTVNDAGLIAQTLTSAGFEVIQGRDLGANDLRSLVRDFLDKAQDLEPGSTVMVYLPDMGCSLKATTTCCRSMPASSATLTCRSRGSGSQTSSAPSSAAPRKCG